MARHRTALALGDSSAAAAAVAAKASAMVGNANLSQRASTLGDYLRDQRRGAHLTLRQLADQAGVSNPYLSQIERGRRKPSADVLQQLAKALRISAETLYVRAGILDSDELGERAVQLAVLSDPALTERQRQVLLDIYNSFRRENEAAAILHDTATTFASP
ncbi:MAG: helix-turn-helix domain-containing protein [Nocardioidaceae bacterium]